MYQPLTVSTEKKERLLDKLSRIEGRIRGLQKMIHDDRNTVDILMQVSASYEALRVVSKSLIQDYIQDSLPSGLMATSNEKREEAYDQLLDVLYKYIK